MRFKGVALLVVMIVLLTIGGAPGAFAAEKAAGQKTKKFATKEEALKDFLNTDESDYLAHFMTRHGELQLVNRNGKYSDSTEVRLNGVTILKAQNNGEGQEQMFMVDLFKFPFQYSPGYKVGPGLEKIDRILLSEGITMRDITHFILLDFTCDKPFVSERFGFNPDLDCQLTLDDVKWGKKKTYIYYDGNLRSVYYTCDRVEEDFDYYDRVEEKKSKKSIKSKAK